MREAVVSATLEELRERGYDGLTISAIAARAGVHESSVYRRWKTREGLMMEATFSMFDQSVGLPDTGSLRGDLAALMGGLGLQLTSPLGHAALQFGLAIRNDAERHQELQALIKDRSKGFAGIFVRAQARGEWRGGSPEWLLDALMGAIYLRVLLRRPVGPEEIEAILSVVFDAAPR